MCRLLAAIAPRPFEVRESLERFAAIAEGSREYQGHGWGCALWNDDDDDDGDDGGGWRIYRSLTPVWQDDLAGFGSTRLLLAHARSAFRNEGIEIENNMPFEAGGDVFIFNGELHGVRIQERGRIGAAKIFNYVRRFRDRGLEGALDHGAAIIEKRTRYVRAMNMILSDGRRTCARCRFSEDPDYFTLYHRPGAGGRPLVVCSDPWPGEAGWRPFANGETRVFPCS